MHFDTLIKNATVIDGSGSQGVIIDIGIQDQCLIRLNGNRTASANTIVDADGLCLSPGFIDVHTHDDIKVIKSPDMLEKISQGVTTVITGNCGISASPVELNSDPPNPMNLLGQRADFQYSTFEDYTKAVELAQPRVNVAALVGHTSLRNNVMNELNRTATSVEITQMQKQLNAAMQCGALGLSSGLAYDSAACATTEELFALIESLQNFDAVYTTHLRTEFDKIIEALNEAFDTADHAKTSLIVSHLKCAGANNWGRSEEIISHIEEHASRQSIACDCYPYAASSSTLDITQVTDDYRVFITWSDARPECAGKYLDEIASSWKVSLVEAANALIPAGAVYYGMHEDDVQNILRFHRSMIGSDGLPNDPYPHPRLWGTFPRVIGHYCRDQSLFDLPQAIHKMTGLSAKNFKLDRRGLIEDNFFADLVLFDFNTIQDKATFTSPIQAASGIEKVWVNGQLSYSDGAITKQRSGKFLKRLER